jgi:penicillin-binding protein 1C
MNNPDSENNQNSFFDPDSHFDREGENKLKQDDLLRRLASPSEEKKPTKPDLADTQPNRISGAPKSSGGLNSEIQNTQQSDNTNISCPAGQVDKAAGWYGEDEGPLPSETPNISQTTVIPVDPNPANQVTRAINTPFNNNSEDLTVPPTNSSGYVTLPNQVHEVDENATRVTPAAYIPPTAGNYAPKAGYRGRGPLNSYPAVAAKPVGKAASKPRQPAKSRDWRSSLGCLLRLSIGAVFIGIFILVVVLSFFIYQYFSIASALPSVNDLSKQAAQFETTRILDRNGNVLYEILDPNAGKRTYVPLNKISPNLVAATIATEDKNYYTNPGFDPFAILRALFQNYLSNTTVSGASTITQQLARALLLSAQERSQQTVERKAREIVLASEITRRYSKDEILELYFNQIYYGNLSYGIEAAAETYFNTSADKLTLGQAAFLAGLPQEPAVYDIFSNRNETLSRQKQVLILMYQLSQSNNCISVSNSSKPVCVDENAAAQASTEIDNYQFQQPQESMRYPHWVNYIRSLLDAQYDPQTIYTSGFTVYTTLDPGLEDMAQQIVTNQIKTLSNIHVTDGALVAIKPSTGEILAMVGSADFNNAAIAGQINMAVSPRQPGSSIKPLTYVTAFEKGWTPSTLIWDVPSQFTPSGNPNDTTGPYVPTDYDGKYRGPVTVRESLASSLNIPAVKTLQFVGIYGDPSNPSQGGLIRMAQRFGITTLTRKDYGLALTLGGGDVTPLELTGAYAVFANNGARIPPVAITKIVDHLGNVVFNYQVPQAVQIIRPEHAYLITSILSDNLARTPTFGANSVLNLPFQVAVKTGTTNDFRDNWTLGYTPDLAVGVWVGNADYTPMIHSTGVSGAAPIWAQFMKGALQSLTGGNPTHFTQPAGIIQRVVCTVSGTEPSDWCPSQRGEIFASNQPPLPKEDDLWQKVTIDTWTGQRASAACSDFTADQFALNVSDPDAIQWIQTTADGKAWAASAGFKDPIYFSPTRDCKLDDPRPTILFEGFTDGQTVNSPSVDIYAVVSATSQFQDFRLQYGVGDDPVDWKNLVKKSTNQYKQPGLIYSWDLTSMPAGKVTLRIYMDSTEGRFAEKRIHLDIEVPTPTPTETAIPTDTQTPIPESTDTPFPTPTDVPVSLDTSAP